MKSYDYQNRQGTRDMTWAEFVTLSEGLAERLAGEGISAVVGIARAGLLPATALACMLRKDLFPVRVTRRTRDRVVSDSPVWKVALPAGSLEGEVVAVVDEMADSGQTLRLVADHAREVGASRVVTVALAAHSWARPVPDLVGLASDALVLFPWDKRVYEGGEWHLHPELAEALEARD